MDAILNKNKRKGKGGGSGSSRSGGGGHDDLAAMILGAKRKNPMEDMVAAMEAKYGGAGKKKKKSKSSKGKKSKAKDDGAFVDPLGDEEFERIQRQMFGNR